MIKQVTQVIALSGLLLYCTSCGGNGQTQEQQPTIVNTARATVTPTLQQKEFSFIAKPLRTSELSFRVSGPIDRFEVYAGNFYRKGSTIARIDPRDFNLRYERTEALYQQAKTEFERIEALYLKENISASSYEKARADYVAAKTAFDTATNELSDSKLSAPFDGYIGQVYIEKFQDVKATQPIVSLVDISKLRIEIYVTQEIILQARELKKIRLSFDSDPEKIYTADVVEYSKSTTSNNLSYLLTALLPNPDGKLPAGISGKVFFDLTAQQGSSVTIPQSALCHQPSQGDFVWVVDPATARVARRKVRKGELQKNSMFSISEGLSEGEIIATSSLRFLSEGKTVQLAQTNISTQ